MGLEALIENASGDEREIYECLYQYVQCHDSDYLNRVSELSAYLDSSERSRVESVIAQLMREGYIRDAYWR